MKARAVLFLTLIGLALPALAQNAPPQRPGGQPGRDRPGPGVMLDRMTERIVETLDLSPEQETQVRQIATEFRARFDQMGPGETRELMREIEDARAKGDQARVDELEARLREVRAGHQQLMGEFLDRVETVLKPDQADRMVDLRGRLGGGPPQGGRPEQLIASLPEKLELNEAQRKQFEQIAAKWRSARDERRKHWEEIRPLMDQLREAQKAGDQQKVDELRKQIQAARSAGAEPIETFFTELEKILTEPQKARLAEIRKQQEGPDPGDALDVRFVIRTAQRLDLNPDQHNSLRDISRKYLREARQSKPGDEAAQKEVVERLKKEIIAVLTPEQAKKFEDALNADSPEKPKKPADHGRHGAGPKP